MEAYKKAVQINPKIASAHYHIGWILNDHERYQEAIASLTEAVRLQPNYPVALVELSYSYRNLKRYEEALEANREATRLKPDYAKPYWPLLTKWA